MASVLIRRRRWWPLTSFTVLAAVFVGLFLWPIGPTVGIGGDVARVTTPGSAGMWAPVVQTGRETVLPWVMRVLPTGGPGERGTNACVQDAWTVAARAHGQPVRDAWRVLDPGRRVDVASGDTYLTEPSGALSVQIPLAVMPVPRFGLDGSTGCSLTLAVTLVFWDALDGGTLLAGRSVAATGTVDTDGTVGEIAGESFKGAAVADAGIRVLFAAPGDVAALAASAGPSVEVVAVGDVASAVAWLRSHPAS